MVVVVMIMTDGGVCDDSRDRDGGGCADSRDRNGGGSTLIYRWWTLEVQIRSICGWYL